MERYHHYCWGRIATQCCSFSKKKSHPSEWLAEHLPEQFNCFPKLLNALRESSNELADCWFGAGGARYDDLNVEFL